MSTMHEIHFDPIVLRFRSAFRLGAGRARPGLKALVQRLADGRPVVPAAALKGALRELAERLCPAVTGAPACRSPFDLCAQQPCPVCRLFGNPRWPGPLYFADFLPRQATTPATIAALRHLSATRAHVGLDRRLGTAVPGLLVQTETLPAGLEFVGAIDGQARADDVPLLQAALLSLNRLGAETTRGLGVCRVIAVEGRIGTEPWRWQASEQGQEGGVA
ncbi:MAG: DUF324 domain-containing protein [Candidatus Ozemobacter sibiricus]|jgi:CRISPR/Cas system CSM-associated protein Csm3 (group 7 of RAMP superfamily)|uniref:DUF324 domain-containing protein n=1 Tax=Candidatus Ozemobacter sibiricus TaxID=2268124 RepID=A0A367ZK53_9BACT|nr:MAG: DUF324 domain-containing protein [Candidatus Ozemobacter sibiricus]